MTYDKGSRPVLLKNVDSVTMPAFGCGLVVDSEEYSDDIVLHVRRPTSTTEAQSPAFKFVFNSGSPIPAGQKGAGNKAAAILGLCDVNATEETLGPKENKWHLEEGNSQFGIIADDPSQAYYDGTSVSKIIETNANAKPKNSECTRIRGICQDGSFESASPDDPITIGSIEGIDAPWEGPSTIEATRPRLHKVWDGCELAAEYNVTAEEWQVYDAQSDKIVHGIKRDENTCEFNKLDGALGWSVWDEGHDAHWITNVDVTDGCVLNVYPNCGDEVNINLEFVKSVKLEYGVIYYTKCDGNHWIADVRPCSEPDDCGVTTYTSQLVEDVLQWVEDEVQANPCSGGCVPGPIPSDPIVVAGRHLVIPCVPE